MTVFAATYGPLAFIVKGAFCTIAVASALISKILDKKLVPCEEDLPGFARTAATVLSTVGIAILFYFDRKYPDNWRLSILATVAVVFLLSFLFYAFLNSKLTICRPRMVKKLTLLQRLKSLFGTTIAEEDTVYVEEQEKVVKGLCFTQAVRDILRHEPSLTEDQIFRGRGYDAICINLRRC
jgi:hypothetical protein